MSEAAQITEANPVPAVGMGNEAEKSTKRTRAEKVSEERRRRRGGVEYTGHRLLFNRALFDDKNYVYRVINDDGQKLQQRTQQDDYELVDDPDKLLKPDGTDLGTKASVVVGRTEGGQPIRGYLARKRRDWFEQDQAEKRAKTEELAREIERPKIEGDKVYTPKGRAFEKD